MTKIEEVARAICRQDCGAYPTDLIARKAYVDSYVEKRWRDYEEHARSAIAAMREPSEAMVKAEALNLLAIWHKVIDAALQEQT